jgi:hypothetical protein
VHAQNVCAFDIMSRMEMTERRWKDLPLFLPLKLIRRFVLFRFWPAVRPLFQTKLAKARHYVGAWSDPEEIGDSQLTLLKMAGCTPDSSVLEIGCGCLIAGLPIMTYLNSDRYVGIEPNTWLVDAAVESKEAKAIIQAKHPLFLHNTDFDGSSTGRKYDFVMSHSILSHAAEWQLPLFLKSVKKNLAPNGVVLSSIRFFTDTGDVAGDSHDAEWVYPGVSFFSWETVQRVAAEQGFKVEWRKDYKEYFVKRFSLHIHDWLRFTLAKPPV